jgi:hypothetical protein
MPDMRLLCGCIGRGQWQPPSATASTTPLSRPASHSPLFSTPLPPKSTHMATAVASVAAATTATIARAVATACHTTTSTFNPLERTGTAANAPPASCECCTDGTARFTPRASCFATRLRRCCSRTTGAFFTAKHHRECCLQPREYHAKWTTHGSAGRMFGLCYRRLRVAMHAHCQLSPKRHRCMSPFRTSEIERIAPLALSLYEAESSTEALLW